MNSYTLGANDCNPVLSYLTNKLKKLNIISSLKSIISFLGSIYVITTLLLFNIQFRIMFQLKFLFDFFAIKTIGALLYRL